MTTHFTTIDTCGSSPYSTSVCRGRLIRDQIDLMPVGAGIQEALIDRPVSAPRPTVPVPAQQTGPRFCQSNKNAGFDCDDEMNMVDVQFNAWPDPNGELKEAARPWHRITVAQQDCRTFPNLGSPPVLGGGGPTVTCTSFAPVPLAYGATFPLDYGTERTSVQWLYRKDYAYWMGSPRRIPDPPAAEKARCEDVRTYGDGTCLDGRMWLHAVYADNLSLGSDASHEFAPDGTHVGRHADQLENHFFETAPDFAFERAYGGLRARQLFFIEFTLPRPPDQFRLDARASLPVIRENGHLFAVFEDGGRADADFLASDALRPKLFDTSLRWLYPAEASPFAGGRSRAAAIALSSDATRYVTAAFVTRDGTLDQPPDGGSPDGGVPDDGGIEGGLPCPLEICPGAVSRASTTASTVGPSPRTDFAAVYSRAQGLVYVIGGRDGAGRLLDELWIYRIDDDAWEQIPHAESLGEVLAATTSWRDGRLWVISRDPAGSGKRTTRLLRIEPSTRNFQVVVSATEDVPTPKYDSRGLFLDMDGNVGIYASSTRAQKHRIGLLRERAGGFDPFMSFRRDRVLSAQPIIDQRGVVLYYEPDRPPQDRSKDPNDDPTPGDRTRAGIRLRALPLGPTKQLAELAELLR